MKRSLLSLVCCFCVGVMSGCVSADRAGESEGDHFRVLVFSATAWYRHDAIETINAYVGELGRAHGFDVDATEDATAFTPENLSRYDVVLFNNTTDIGKSLDAPQREAFMRWFRAGGGYAGIHAASVHHKTWPWYERMLGTDFNSDVERQPGRVLVDDEGSGHPAVRGFGPELHLEEEWMHYESSVRGLPGTRVLLTLDESSIDTTVKPYFRDKGGRAMGGDHPVAWARTFEGGRVFYTNLGHSADALQTSFGRAHLLGGLRWAAGR